MPKPKGAVIAGGEIQKLPFEETLKRLKAIEKAEMILTPLTTNPEE